MLSKSLDSASCVLAVTGAGLCGGSAEEAQPRWENQVSLCCLPKPAGAHSASFARDLTRILPKVLFDERLTKWWMLKQTNKQTSDAGELWELHLERSI